MTTGRVALWKLAVILLGCGRPVTPAPPPVVLLERRPPVTRSAPEQTTHCRREHGVYRCVYDDVWITAPYNTIDTQETWTGVLFLTDDNTLWLGDTNSGEVLQVGSNITAVAGSETYPRAVVARGEEAIGILIQDAEPRAGVLWRQDLGDTVTNLFTDGLVVCSTLVTDGGLWCWSAAAEGHCETYVCDPVRLPVRSTLPLVAASNGLCGSDPERGVWCFTGVVDNAYSQTILHREIPPVARLFAFHGYLCGLTQEDNLYCTPSPSRERIIRMRGGRSRRVEHLGRVTNLVVTPSQVCWVSEVGEPECL